MSLEPCEAEASAEPVPGPALFPVDLARLAHAHGAAGHQLQRGGEGAVLGLLHPLGQRGLRVPRLHRHRLLEDDGPGVHLLLQHTRQGRAGTEGTPGVPRGAGGNRGLGWWDGESTGWGEQGLAVVGKGSERAGGRQNSRTATILSQKSSGMGGAGLGRTSSQRGNEPRAAQSQDRSSLEHCWGRALQGRGCSSAAATQRNTKSWQREKNAVFPSIGKSDSILFFQGKAKMLRQIPAAEGEESQRRDL